MFGTRGFHSVGIRDICNEAGLTERYFYESFKNREALYQAVFEQSVTRVREQMERAMADNAHLDPRDAARVAMRQYLETLRHDPRLVRVLLIDVMGIGADVGSLSISASRSFTALIVPAMTAMFPGLPARGVDFQAIADGLVGACIFLVTQWALSDFEAPLERVLDHCMLFFHGIGHALADEDLGGVDSATN